MSTINIIKDSFELWYNTVVSKDNPVFIVINYSDLQALSIKAYHKSTIEMVAIETVDGVSRASSLIKLEENYNHGITNEDEAKENMAKKLLLEVYKYIQLL